MNATGLYAGDIGDLVETIRRLHVAGFDSRLLQKINSSQSLADRMFAATQVDPSRFRYPDWWPGYEAQIEYVRQRHPKVEISDPPQIFVPWTMTEVPLLHVHYPIQQMFDDITLPEGWDAQVEGVVIENIRGVGPHNGGSSRRAVWLAFDYAAYEGVAPRDVPLRPRSLADRELFSALIQFPEWIRTWRDTYQGRDFLLSGCRYRDRHGEDMVPVFDLRSTRLWLQGRADYRDDPSQSSPTVRPLRTA